MLSGIPFPPPSAGFFSCSSLTRILPPSPALRGLEFGFVVKLCFGFFNNVSLFSNHLPHHTTIVRWHGLNSQIFSVFHLDFYLFFLSHAAISHSRPSVFFPFLCFSSSSSPLLLSLSVSLALSLYIRPLLVVSGFRTSGG